jgi:hypothetical protein
MTCAVVERITTNSPKQEQSREIPFTRASKVEIAKQPNNIAENIAALASHRPKMRSSPPAISHQGRTTARI